MPMKPDNAFAAVWSGGMAMGLFMLAATTKNSFAVAYDAIGGLICLGLCGLNVSVLLRRKP